MGNIRTFIILYLFVFILQISTGFLMNTMPSFRVIAPQYICKSEHNNTANYKSTGVTVEFQPKQGLHLSYIFRIEFKVALANTFTQREILLIWKAVRRLENTLNGARHSAVSENNLAIIHESEVVPGIIYVFHVTGKTDTGEISPEYSFHIQYDDIIDDLNFSALSPHGINLLIIGSAEVVSNMDYNVVAKVNFCSRKYEYHIQWALEDLPEEHRQLQNNIGSCLRIPRNVLNPQIKSNIVAKIVETGTGRTLTVGNITVEVFSKGFEVMIMPTAVKIGIGTKATLRLFIRNYDYIKQISIQWKCINRVNKKILLSCQLYNNMSYIQVKLSKEGSYQVLAYVTINEILSKVNADIEVVPFTFISFDFHDVPNLNPPSEEGFQFSVMVLNLVPNCEAIWLSAQEYGFKFIKPGVLGKHHYGYKKIPDLEKNYLEQIADFVNHTVKEEIALTIPAAQRELNGQSMWRGFEEDAVYKFRLDITCPKAYTETKFPKMVATELLNQFATSYFSFDIHTNSPPKVEYLIVQPTMGNALKSVFHVHSSSGKDLLLDSPISYELTLKVDGLNIQFAKYFDYKSWDILLPFSRNLLIMQVTVCDVRLSCTTIQNNTDLYVVYEEFSEKEFRSHFQDIQAAFQRTDFNEAFNLLLMTTITLKAANSALWKQWPSLVRAVISEELEKLAKYTGNEVYIPPMLILKFIKQAKELLEYLQLIDYKDLHYLLKITENLIDFQELNSNDITITMSNNLRTHEIFQNQMTNSAIKHAYIYADIYLSILEELLKHKQIDQNNFINKVIDLLRNFCLIPAIRNVTLNTSTVVLRVIKRQGDFLQHYYELKHYIPGKLQLKLNLKLFTKINLIAADKVYCVFAIYYNFLMYSLKESQLLHYGIYEVLYNHNQIREIQFPFNHDNENSFKTEWLLNANRPDENGNANICLFTKSMLNYTTTKWTPHFCSFTKHFKFFKCHCSQHGFLKIAYWPRKVIANQTISNNILREFSTNAPSNANLSMLNANKNSILKDDWNSTYNIKGSKTAHLAYIVSVILVILIIAFVIVFIKYFRYRQRLPKLLGKPPIFKLESRQAVMGIHYASVADKHLLNGKLI